MDQYFEVRKAKISNWKTRQIAYPGKFEKTHTAHQIKELPDGVENIKTAGRLMSFREMGKLAFAHLQDHTGRIQLSFRVDDLGAEEFKFLAKNLDIGDYIGVEGFTKTTQKGEKTLGIKKCLLLAKGLHPLPEKFHGIQDPELKARNRYLDLVMNADTREKFRVRHGIVHFIRKFLTQNQFLEVETPILQSISSGASARPFITHHNALDMPLYLRIAPETYLKRLVVGGYERVFEMAKCFRNEGIDPSHLQEFTMLEFYAAYWDARDNMRFIQDLLQNLLQEVLGTQEITYQGVKLDFSGNWPEHKYADMVNEYTGIDILKVENIEELKSKITAKNLDLPLDKYVSLGGLIDGLYKKFCRPHLIQPMFLTQHRQELVPLARKNDDNPLVLDMFQVVVNSWEIVKAYSELVDPIEQRERLLEQADLAKAGDDEAMMMEEDFLLAMEYGMPPMSGLGMGIDRLAALLTDSENIRDVIYFPSLRVAESEFDLLTET